VQKLMQDVLDRYGAGIRVDRLQLLKADPPTGTAGPAGAAIGSSSRSRKD